MAQDMTVDSKTSLQESTVDQAAKTFEALLFPPETQDASTETPETAAPAEVTEPEAVEAVEAETTEATQDAESTETPETPPTKRSRKLKLDGKDVDVDEDEAYNGYLRQADYTRKTQKAAEAQKRADETEKAARDARDAYAAQLAQAKATLDMLVPGEPNWADLRTKLTPEEFSGAYANWSSFKQQRDQLIATQDRVQKEKDADTQRQREEHIAAQYEQLQNTIPEWRDEAKAQAGLQEVADYLIGKGWSKAEVKNVTDARTIMTVRNSMLYERLQSKMPGAKAAVQARLKTAPAGSPASTSRSAPATGTKAAREKLAKSGRIDDAANLFLTMLG